MVPESVQISLQGIFGFGGLSELEAYVGGPRINDTRGAFDDVGPA